MLYWTDMLFIAFGLMPVIYLITKISEYFTAITKKERAILADYYARQNAGLKKTDNVRK